MTKDHLDRHNRRRCLACRTERRLRGLPEPAFGSKRIESPVIEPRRRDRNDARRAEAHDAMYRRWFEQRALQMPMVDLLRGAFRKEKDILAHGPPATFPCYAADREEARRKLEESHGAS